MRNDLGSLILSMDIADVRALTRLSAIIKSGGFEWSDTGLLSADADWIETSFGRAEKAEQTLADRFDALEDTAFADVAEEEMDHASDARRMTQLAAQALGALALLRYVLAPIMPFEDLLNWADNIKHGDKT